MWCDVNVTNVWASRTSKLKMESFSIHYIPSEIRSFRLTKGNERYEIYFTCVMAREREREWEREKERKKATNKSYFSAANWARTLLKTMANRIRTQQPAFKVQNGLAKWGSILARLDSALNQTEPSLLVFLMELGAVDDSSISWWNTVSQKMPCHHEINQLPLRIFPQVHGCEDNVHRRVISSIRRRVWRQIRGFCRHRTFVSFLSSIFWKFQS